MKIVVDNDKVTPSQKKAFADGSKDLLTDLAFQEAIKRCRKQWFAELMQDGLTLERQAELRAKMMALEAIAQRLQSMIRDQLDAEQRSKTSG
jgi:hypothetical protein